jgi:hypothetical protein
MINRDAYKSLLESVNDAVLGVEEEEIAEGIKWGDKSIGGARNARELAAWLNSQGKGGKGSTRTSASSAGSVSGTSVVSEGIKWGDKAIGGARNARELAAYLNRMSARTPSASSAGSVSYGGGGTSVVSEGMKWGDSRIGGARNARELAAYLNRMSTRTPSASSAGSVSGSGSGGTSVVSEGIKWGDKAIGGARNARELAAWLNSQGKGKGKASRPSMSSDTASGTSVVSEAKRGLSGRRLTHQLNSMMPAPSAGSASKSPSATAAGGSKSSGASMTVSEDWDILDEILLEGLELYGEEGLAEILADFAETGEISDELALLLSDE